MVDHTPQVLRPHERRSLQSRSEYIDANEPVIAPPSLDVVEACERTFLAELPDILNAEETFAIVQRKLGQQDVLRFLRNLLEDHKGA